MLVFALGLAFLGYSLYAFFHPPEPFYARKSQSMKPNAPKSSPVSQITRPPEAVAFNFSEEQRRKFVEELRKPADEYLKKYRLGMQIPEGVYFLNEQDGATNVLLGAYEPGKVGIYLFSMRGKVQTKKQTEYLKKFFSEQFSLNVKGAGQNYPNRGGFKDMVLYKGVTSAGEEYQAYLFQHPKTKTHHIFFLRDKQLSRQPARVRELVDSIRVR